MVGRRDVGDEPCPGHGHDGLRLSARVPGHLTKYPFSFGSTSSASSTNTANAHTAKVLPFPTRRNSTIVREKALDILPR